MHFTALAAIFTALKEVITTGTETGVEVGYGGLIFHLWKHNFWARMGGRESGMEEGREIGGVRREIVGRGVGRRG